MGVLYLLPLSLLYLLDAFLLSSIIFQCLNLSFGLRSLEQVHFLNVETMREIAVLAQTCIPFIMLSYIICTLLDGNVLLPKFYLLRIFCFLFITFMSSRLIFKKKSFDLALVIIPSAFLLPLGDHYRIKFVLFLLSSAFWFLKSLNMLFNNLDEHKEKLTASSLKEVVDSLDSGLLYCYKNGRILLVNLTMQKLMISITGKQQINGMRFYEALLNNKIAKDCKKIDMPGQLLFVLNDKSVWSFNIHHMDDNKNVLLVSSDVTEWYNTGIAIKEKNMELQIKNDELRSVLANLEELCRREAVLQAKGRVHDVLGQSISLLLRAMREHKEPDEVLLKSFAEGLPVELKEITNDGGYSLDTLAKVFKNLGVTLKIDGWLPSCPSSAKIFYEIAAEAVTNAVRHGYATEVFINFSTLGDMYVMEVRNKCLSSEKEIKEGGGLVSMREKVTKAGGRFYYEAGEEFVINAILPKGVS